MKLVVSLLKWVYWRERRSPELLSCSFEIIQSGTFALINLLYMLFRMIAM